ncbi:MAG TPA: PIG-L family deacetylase [Roseiarcus sp.]|nr:PIG-L family deacetylase [Roseiarcus sp.]
MPSLAWLADEHAAPMEASRVAVVVAHPDDETIGCGALIARSPGINIVMVTDGAPSDLTNAHRAGFASAADYGRARARELRSALAIAGVDQTQIFAMDVADGGVWRTLVSVSQRLASFFDERGVDMVLTHAFEGGHSDHDGVAYAVRLAAGLMFRRAPAVIEMPFYHESADGLKYQSFCDGEDGMVARLTEGQVAKKRAMLDAFPSQAHVLHCIDPSVERFRLAKPYDFRSAPNGGVILYGRRATDLGLPDWMRRQAPAPTAEGAAASAPRRDRRAA